VYYLSRLFWHGISAIGHLLLFLGMILFFDFSKQIPTLGDHSAVLIRSYLYSQPVAAGALMQTQTQRAMPETTLIKKSLLQHQIERQHQAKKQQIHQVTPLAKVSSSSKDRAKKEGKNSHQQSDAALSQGNTRDALLMLLHTAIQKQQHYPQSAMQMERQGRVTVGFLVLKNGMVQALRLLKSSGTASLDEAALSAVRHASPFKNVDQYLTDAQEFNIDVVFELT
jgi:TonB family protein